MAGNRDNNEVRQRRDVGHQQFGERAGQVGVVMKFKVEDRGAQRILVQAGCRKGVDSRG